MKYFALTGAAGYIAPRHLQAIADTGNTLLAALDPNDSVGILDRYAPQAQFFTEPEKFAEYLQLQNQTDTPIDYVSICAPNQLHAPHIRMALNAGSDAICEKPLVLHAEQLDQLEALEQQTGKRVYTLLQLRFHETILKLKEQFPKADANSKHEIVLTYITSRGPWYYESWKGDHNKSGGPASNIGIHFFDMLTWIFGSAKHSELHLSDAQKMSGFMELEHARVRWYLSMDRNDLPKEAVQAGAPAYRSITIDGEEVEFSGGFTDLHTRVYEETLKGNGFGIADARPSIELVCALRDMPLITDSVNIHPYV